MLPLTAALQQAHAQDRRLAEALLERLLQGGRNGHPAIAHLRVVLAEKSDLDHLVNLAAIAFETAVRLDAGQVAGEMAREGRRHHRIAPFLVDRTPTDWESRSRIPYTEVDWRGVVAAAAEEVRRDAFAMPMVIPGAHLYEELRVQSADLDTFLGLILGDTVRDDTLDPVATSGNFLAQAMPGYLDVDLLFRQYRETLVAQELGED